MNKQTKAQRLADSLGNLSFGGLGDSDTFCLDERSEKVVDEAIEEIRRLDQESAELLEALQLFITFSSSANSISVRLRTEHITRARNLTARIESQRGAQ